MTQAEHNSIQQDRILRAKQVCEILSIGRTHLYEQVKSGTFPIPVQLGERAVGWRLSDINAWIVARPSARS